MKQKYFLYARKSSEAEEKQVMSIEAQLFELKEFATREKLEIVEIFQESKSAKEPGRSEFNKMLSKIYASKEPIGILAWHPDRLARNSVDGGQVIYLIDIKKICALKFPTFWFEPTPQGLFMLQVAFGQSKYYSDNLAENVKRGIRQKLRRGEFYGFAPLGYVNNPKTRNIDQDPVKAKIVQQVFKEYAQGKYTLDSMRERLKFWGIVTKKGTTLARSTVRRVLSDKAYLGIITLTGESYEGNFEPLIDKSTFETVQRILNGRSRPRKSKKSHDFAYLGLFKCGECGGAITAQFAKGNGGLYRYYRCTKRMRIKCSQGYLREDLVTKQIADQIQKITIPDDWAENMLGQIETWGKQTEKEMRSFAQNNERDIKETEQKLDKLVTTFLEGLIEKEEYLKRKDELIKTKTDLNKRKEDFGHKGAFWIEPLRDWVKASNSAEKIASSNDSNQIKLLLEKIGTNRLLRAKKIEFDFVQPYDKVALYKGLKETSTAGAVLVLEDSGGESPAWYPEPESNRHISEDTGV
jgi:site-specific DNA recombinase